MQAKLWNKGNVQLDNKAVANDPETFEVYKNADGTEKTMFFLDPSSLIRISNECNADCYVRDFSEGCFYLVMTDDDNERKKLHFQYIFFPINGWTDNDVFEKYLRTHRDYFRDCFKYYRADNSPNGRKASDLVRRMDLPGKFLERFKAEHLLSAAEVLENEKRISEESNYHFAITLPAELAC